MTYIPKNGCKHINKIATDSENMDGEIYWECLDCKCGWRAEAITEKEKRMAEKINDKNFRLDAEALGIDID